MRDLKKEDFGILYAGQLMDDLQTMEELLEDIDEYYEPLVLYLHHLPKNKQEVNSVKLED